MIYKDFTIKVGESTNYKGETSEQYYCKISNLKSITTGNLKDMITYLDDQIANAIHYAEAEAFSKECMERHYSFKSDYLYNE